MDAYGQLVNPQTVVFERLLPGPIERVFAFLTEEDKRRQWFTTGAMPTKVGERFTMRWHHSDYSPNKSVPPDSMKEMDEKGHSGTFVLLAYEPPHRLAYTFGEDKLGPNKVTEVEFRLKPEGDQVRLTLTHTKVPDRGFALGVSRGWHSHLDVLDYQLRGETPPGFWDIWRRYDGVYEKRYG
jgi:uncharacterized protein YndB with AHSA1/START domain